MDSKRGLSRIASFKEAFNEAYKLNEFRAQTGYWSPSSLGQCDRRSVLEHSGVQPNPLDLATARKFWLGKKLHEALQAEVPEQFVVLGNELRVRDDEFKVSGRLDTLISNNSTIECIEFKTISSKVYTINEYSKILPKQDHILQLGCYLKFRANCPCSVPEKMAADPGGEVVRPKGGKEVPEISERPRSVQSNQAQGHGSKVRSARAPRIRGPMPDLPNEEGGGSGPRPLDGQLSWDSMQPLQRGARADWGEEPSKGCKLCGGSGKLPLPDQGRLVYLERDGGHMLEFVVTLTPELDLAIEFELKRLEAMYQHYLKTGELPSALPEVYNAKEKKNKPDPRVAWCPFRGKGCCGDKRGGKGL